MDKFAIHHLKRIAKQVSAIEENLQNMKSDIFVLSGYFDGGFDYPNEKKNWYKEGKTKVMLIKERLIKAREKKGYSQVEVARKLGFSNNSMYCRIENGKKNASLAVATEIADILEVSLDWLLGKGD